MMRAFTAAAATLAAAAGFASAWQDASEGLTPYSIYACEFLHLLVLAGASWVSNACDFLYLCCLSTPRPLHRAMMAIRASSPTSPHLGSWSGQLVAVGCPAARIRTDATQTAST